MSADQNQRTWQTATIMAAVTGHILTDFHNEPKQTTRLPIANEVNLSCPQS